MCSVYVQIKLVAAITIYRTLNLKPCRLKLNRMKPSIRLVTTVSMMLLTQLSTITESHVKRSKCRSDVLKRPYLGRLDYKTSENLKITPFDPDDDRIIGGDETTVQDNPFMISLLYRPVIDEEEVYFKCGAAIIHKQWAVTAAHCLASVQQKMVKEGLVFLRGNSSYWQSPEAVRNDHFIKYYQKHERYIGSKTDYDYDICIMKVKEEFDGLHEIPIAVAHNSYKYVEGTTATVLGWGVTSNDENSNSSPVLRGAAISLTNFKHCQKVHRRIHKTVTNRMVCAWKNNADSCFGDSGGPLIQKQALIGIVSWGVKCASPDWPGVYTRLSEYSGWISERIHHCRSC